MRINLAMESKEGAWTLNYRKDVTDGFIKLGHNCHFVDLEELNLFPETLAKAPPCDVWLIGGSSNWRSLDVCVVAHDRKEKVVAYVDGGPEVPGFIMYKEVAKQIERNTKECWPYIDGWFFNHKAYHRWFTAFYKDEYEKRHIRGYVIPYPLDPVRYTESPNKSMILFPGKMIYLKQPILAAKLLEPFKQSVIFSQSDDIDARAEMKHYISLLREDGYDVHTNVKGADYLELLAQAKVVVCTSTGESACVEILEGVMSGAVPVVPDLPEFMEYPFWCRYEPYLISDFRNTVGNARQNHYREELEAVIDQHYHINVVKQMIKAIYECTGVK